VKAYSEDFTDQEAVSAIHRITRGNIPFSKIASAWFDVGTAELEQSG
jgi:hypothetical protein